MEESVNFSGKPLESGADPFGGESGEGDETGNDRGILRQIRECFPGKCQDVRSYSPLALAYMGDAVYDLVIRTVLVERANRSSNELHKLAVKYVSAGAQSRIAEALLERLTEEERAVYRRGKNSTPHTMAKNASAAEYLRATGLEAVLGYLYLKGDMERVLALMKEGIGLAGIKDGVV